MTHRHSLIELNFMHAINHTLSKHLTPIIVIILLFIIPTLASAVEKTKKTPAVKQTKTKASSSTSRTKAAKAAPKVDDETARTTFETFTQEWMTKLAEAEEFHRTKLVKVTQTPDGYSAEYEGYLPQRFIEVRKTEYEDTPFVGTLTYNQRTLRCTGKTKEEALQGPFQQAETAPVREIFRFTKGKWVY